MKFTRTKKEIIKYVDKEIRLYEKFKKKSSIDSEKKEYEIVIYIFNKLKRFMTTKTDWLEL